jgi:Zn-dependent protease with chaperone function
MLDLIGYNADEWAALLGHELAHLILEHSGKGEFRRTTLTVLRGPNIGVPFSAARALWAEYIGFCDHLLVNS